MTAGKSVLMIVTSHARLGATGAATGFWLEELAAPYFEFIKAGATVDIASPQGGKPPVDPKSEGDQSAAVKAFLADATATAKLDGSLRLDEVKSAYDAYFVVGGHGVMWDLVDNAALAALLSRAYDGGRVVAAVCHGPAALVNVRLGNGGHLVAGKRVSAFTNDEETAAGLDQAVPFALESTLKDRGARFEAGPRWGSFAVRDGKLVTGQNPASSAAVARGVLEALD